MITDLLMCAGSGLFGATALYVVWGRGVGKRMHQLEGRVMAALPAAQDEQDAAVEREIALMELNDAPPEDIAALRTKRALTAGLETIPDVGIDIREVDKRAAFALARHALVSRSQTRLTPKQAALRWNPGTVFRDSNDDVFIVTHKKPLCIYREGCEANQWSERPFAQFEGWVEMLVTPAEVRANRLQG